MFSVIVLFTTVPVIKDALRILMEGSPEELDHIKVFNALNSLDVVDEVHDFHLWSISAEKPIMTAHVISQHPPAFVLFEITKMLQGEFDICHTTIQVEPNPNKAGGAYRPAKLHNCINEYNFISENPTVQ